MDDMRWRCEQIVQRHLCCTAATTHEVSPRCAWRAVPSMWESVSWTQNAQNSSSQDS